MTKVKRRPKMSPPKQLKSILKKRETNIPDCVPPTKSFKHQGETTEVSHSETNKRRSLPPPPVPTTPRPTRRKHGKKETPKNDTTKVDKVTSKQEQVVSKNDEVTTVKGSKKVESSDVSNNPSPSSSTHEHSSIDSLDGKMTETKPTSPVIPEVSSDGDKVGLAKVENAEGSDGKTVIKVDSSTLFVPKRPSKTSKVPASKSSKNSESVYGGLMEFENAILENDDKTKVKKNLR